ncbi:MAG: asparaginase [Candidatus Nanopelagicales bacterium]|nr:asparaginase [Candidatus Nanopelagicales bacterium]
MSVTQGGPSGAGIRMSAVPLAGYTRSGLLEGVFFGHAVILNRDRSIEQSWGSTTDIFFPRSSNKIAQATAMARLGLTLPPHLQALTAASHSAEDFHVAGVLEILSTAGLTPAALLTPPDYPLDPVERTACIARGEDPAPILMNCSGKHAGMLATCVINGWDTSHYLHSEHPLQVAIRAELEDLSGEKVMVVGTDGCGAPVMALTLPGLARIAHSAVTADPGEPARTVADAMRHHPEYVGGTRRDVTHFMQRIPGLLAKDGAEGVYVAATEDGRAVALKMEDGSDRGRNAAMAGLLVTMGFPASLFEDYLHQPLLGGGHQVGSVHSLITSG